MCVCACVCMRACVHFTYQNKMNTYLSILK